MATLNRAYTFVTLTLGRAAHVEGEFDNFRATINTRVCADGTLHFTGGDPLTLEYDDPYLEFIDTQSSGETWRIKGSVDGTAWLDIDYYDTGTSTWVNLMRFPRAPSAQRAQMDMDVQVMTLIVRDNTPTVTFEGLEANAEIFRFEEDTGVLNIDFYNSGTTDWDTLAMLTNTHIVMYVPVQMDEIYEYSLGSGITLKDNVIAEANLDVAGEVTFTGTVNLDGALPVATDKCIAANNLGMKKVCVLTFSDNEINAGDNHDGNQYVYKSVTGATGGGLLWFEPMIYSAVLPLSYGVEVKMVYATSDTWQVCIVVHGFSHSVTDEVVIDVYEWQENPADHV